MPPLGAQGLRAAPGSTTAACPPSHVAMRSRAIRPHISMYGHRPVWGRAGQRRQRQQPAATACWLLAPAAGWLPLLAPGSSSSSQQQQRPAAAVALRTQDSAAAARLHSAIYSTSYPGQPSPCH